MPREPRIAYLGPAGTHSHEACLRRFGGRVQGVACRNLAEVLERLNVSDPAERADAAVVPMENSVEGPVTQTLDLLALHEEIDLRESFCLAIRQHLLAARSVTRLADVQRVYSHPQALAQCRAWLHRHLPAADQVPTASTAEAARLAAGDAHGAAVAGELAGRLHGLSFRVRDIQDAADNTTRFLTVTARPGSRLPLGKPLSGERRMLLFLVLPDRPGALLHGLIPFETGRLNLTFIQSRPLAGKSWEYGFFVEVQTAGRGAALKSTLAILATIADSCRVLGHYPCRLRRLPEASGARPPARVPPAKGRPSVARRHGSARGPQTRGRT